MKIAIGLGSSLGNRFATLELAVRKLAANSHLELIKVSSWYRTPPMRGGTASGWFLNGVALFETSQTPEQVLTLCKRLEDDAGRRRARHWGDRTLDLDLLIAEGHHQSSAGLTLPHPGIGDRSFVLLPLVAVWPEAQDDTGKLYADFPRPSDPSPVPVGIMKNALGGIG